ncbi:TrbI/VirB10 family protein [Nitrobacter sp.]|uniref:TrbI/VirB10 family protein n=1 Tax=Nitrobacter sp. TaxID=29420 RepID=UPI0039B5B4D2
MSEQGQAALAPLDGPAAPAAPQAFRLRGTPPRVMRLSRKTLAVLGVAAGFGIGGSLIYALKPAGHRETKELYNTDNRSTADVIASAPNDYGQVPKLGPPLPGDLGRPIVSAQERDGLAQPTGAGAESSAASAVAEARQRVAQEHDAARTSKLFLGGSTAGNAGTNAATPDLLAAAMQGTAATNSGSPTTPPSDEAAQTGQAARRAFLKDDGDRRTASLDRLTSPPSPYVVQAGSVIAAALITGIRSDLPGQITAQVTQNVYDSPTGRILLIPQGSKLIGEYDSSVSFGQSRVLLAWTRLILPDGRSISLERQPGADAAGYAGLEDRVNNHWGKLFKSAILSTLLSVGSEAGTSQSENNLAQALRAGAANGFSQAGQQVVARELNIQPTLAVRPGYPVRVLVTADLILEPVGGGQ